nr:4-diphosphocytidyl-2C-methyl-D-erythritol kinase [Lysinibacillus timonensis]
MEVREPLLFIQSPPFYYIDVRETTVNEEDNILEESTSVYELTRTEKIHDEVIVRQLGYFSQPVNRNRSLTFHLEDGEKLVGKINEIDGIHVKVKTNNNIVLINGNEIKAITLSNREY